MRNLCAAVTRAKTAIEPARACSVASSRRSSSRPVTACPPRLGDAEFSRDRERRLRMIAGDHHDPHAGALAEVDRTFRLRSRRVVHAGQPDEDEIGLDLLGRKPFGRPFDVATGGREHAQRPPRHRLHLRGDLAARGVVDRGDRAPPRDVRAAAEDHVGSALHHRARRPVGEPPHDRHALAIRVEGEVVDLRRRGVDGLDRDPELPRCGEQRPFGGISDHGPDAALFAETGAVAAGEERRELADARRNVPRLGRHLSARRVALARDAAARVARPELAHRHLADGEGAGLVAADHVGRAERLDGVQAPDERTATRHALDADGERDRHDGRQPLRHRRDRERDRREEQLERRQAAQPAREEDERDDAERAPRQEPSEPGELPLQRRAAVVRRGRDEARDRADLGRDSRGDDDRGRAAGSDAGAHVHHVAAVGERRRRVAQPVRVLLDRHRLAGERRFAGGQRRGFDQPGIGRDDVARLELDDITRDDLDRRHDAGDPVATYARVRGRHAAQRSDRLLRVVLLVEADQRVQDDDREDREAIAPLAGDAGDDPRRDQDRDHDALELREQDREGPDGRGLGELVPAVLLESPARLLLSQTEARVRDQELEARLRSHGVPWRTTRGRLARHREP